MITRLDEPELRRIEIGPGTICRLTAGTQTRWDVAETLRKVYIIGVPTSPADSGSA